MIVVDRGVEPPALATVRTKELARLRLVTAPTAKDVGDAYQVAKDALWRAQHHKCAYCEAIEQAKRNDVEHFRPKGRALRQPGATEEHGYWWLAFTWENLVFACRNCNQSPAKLDKFPLAVGSVALFPETPPPGLEQPLLLDPAADDGRAHIQYRAVDVRGAVRWQPFARGGSARGQKTIEVCQLDRGELVELYTEHVELYVAPRVGELLRAHDVGDDAAVQAVFHRIAVELFSPRQGFTALAIDAVEHLVSSDVRGAHHLRLP